MFFVVDEIMADCVCYRMSPRKLFVFTDGVFILGYVTDVINKL